MMMLIAEVFATTFLTLFMVATAIHCFYVLRDGGRDKK